jgi:branched-chain amino acid transport system permease protein
MRPVSVLRSGVRSGLMIGLVAIFIVLIGMVQTFAKRFLVGDLTLSMVILVTFGVAAASLAAGQVDKSDARLSRKLLAGVIASFITGVALASMLFLASMVPMRDVLVNVTPEMVAALSFGLPVGVGAAALVLLSVTVGVLAILARLLPPRLGRLLWETIAAVILVGLFWEAITGLDISRLFLTTTGLKAGKTLPTLGAVLVVVVVAAVGLLRSRARPAVPGKVAVPAFTTGGARRYVVMGLIVGALAALPFAVGLFWSQTLTTIGLFALMGLGLNIVVGMAGLLDLGYVAFYAIGAYTMALLSSPASSAHLGIPFWVALPVALLAAATAGILLGIPVLRLRGDYLAIVTLGFGEIIRLLAQSDMLKPYIGGPQGILETPSPNFFGIPMDDPRYLYYLLLGACLVVVFLSMRLNDSRVGRSWIAVREDEDVAQAMGINLVVAKLMAFAIGAAFAGVGGAIFASRQGAIFPADFTLFVSINVLCLIIIGGIGSIPGVITGAFFLVGLPEVLREVDEYRILAYGAGLVIMMIVKPEGLVPSARRRLELHEAERIATPEDGAAISEA